MENTVLVVDDDRDVRELLRVVLEDTFGDVRTYFARSADEAVSLAQTMEPALVLLDLALPEPEGLGVVARLRTNPATRGIPVIAITVMDDLRKQAREAGCVGFLEKPFDLDDFVAAVQPYLSIHSRVSPTHPHRQTHAA